MAKPKKPAQYNRRLLLIEWVDASRLTHGDWMDLKNIDPPSPHTCLSVGFIAAENERGIILVPTIADIGNEDNSHVYGGIMIPRGSIVARQVLR